MRRREGDRGSAALEAAIIAPVLVAFVLIAVAAGRIQSTGGVVDAAARSGARAASLARTPEGAQQAAAEAVQEVLGGQGARCEGAERPPIEYGTLDTPTGRLDTVTVQVSCTVRLSDLLIDVVPGSKTMTASFTSVLDHYRGTEPGKKARNQ
ncbi:Flp pilus assembly protein TadG [Kitasatospora gansuensis]|uniref:Flp pilus assembly protein TadG n=1 Tax=Kitasatospora gansuensis TaxID=258050 RepID=A0A7W7WGM7_9ACTN|nr:TadE family protein [Kitasatospora gansuensis]MBB4945614.1 Flp pilus assembly protein TadG [Kitasatospora gansuensis]